MKTSHASSRFKMIFWSILALLSIALQWLTFGPPHANYDSAIWFILGVVGWFVTGLCLAPLSLFMPKPDRK